jgi:hypothetical protein
VRRAAVPLALIFVSLWLLVGCLYLPSREKVRLTGTREDFRELPGYDAARQPHVDGRFTRDSIEAVLGRPPYASQSGRRVMYVVHVKSGALIAPLCFTARDREDHCVGLVLTYDAAGRLTAWHKVEASWSGSLFDEPYGFDASQRLEDTSETFVLGQANFDDGGDTTRPSEPHVIAGPDALVPTK